jgi:hypothetical protein
MPTSKDSLKDRLAGYRQIKISVIGRKSGRTISIPVWFVLEGGRLYLAEFRAVPVTDGKTVKSVVAKFKEKYGAGDVKKYYSKFDVAVFSELA